VGGFLSRHVMAAPTLASAAAPKPTGATAEGAGIAALARAIAAASRQGGHRDKDLLGGLEAIDSRGDDRIAKGPATIASVVTTPEHWPEIILAQPQKKIARELACYFGETGSLESHADSVRDSTARHKPFKKCAEIFCELQRESGAEPRVQAFAA